MKILIVTQHFYPENFRFNDLALHLGQFNEVTVLTGIPNYPVGKFYKGYSFFRPFKEKYGPLTIVRSPLIPRGSSKLFLVFNYISFAIFSSVMVVALSLFKKFDKVLVCQSSPIFMALPANIYRMITKTPVALWITDLWPESLVATNAVRNRVVLRIVERYVKWTYQNVDLILTSCKGFRESIEKKITNKEIKYFPYWAEDFYKITPPNQEIKLPEDKFILMFAGNIGVAQNLQLLVRAVKELQNKSILIVLIGDGRARIDLESAVEREGIKDQFVFLGSHPPSKMPSYFAHADALYLSLRKDPIFEITVPSKLQSYMACGKPIIASVDGEAAGVINDAKCGLVSSANDLESLINNLNKATLWNNFQKKAYGECAQNFCKKHFNRAILMDDINKTLENLSYK